MSLINDALKRAREADRKRRAQPPSIPLQPVEAPVQPAARSKWILVAIVLVAAGLSLWSFSRWGNHAAPNAQPEPSTLAQSPPPAPHRDPSLTPSVQPTPPPAAAPVPEPAEAVPTVPVTTNPPPIASVEAASPPPPADDDATPAEADILPPAAEVEFRLQSILYRARNPMVVINGQFLGQGDSIAGATIVRVETQQVTLSRDETNIVLTMPAY